MKAKITWLGIAALILISGMLLGCGANGVGLVGVHISSIVIQSNVTDGSNSLTFFLEGSGFVPGTTTVTLVPKAVTNTSGNSYSLPVFDANKMTVLASTKHIEVYVETTGKFYCPETYTYTVYVTVPPNNASNSVTLTIIPIPAPTPTPKLFKTKF